MQALQPKPGFCAVTDDSLPGSCNFGFAGSWREHTTLDACVRACRKCNRCNYISFSSSASDCSWYFDCFSPLQTRVPGNGGMLDNCNCDGYASSIYTITIGAIDEHDQVPHYAESCAACLAVAYSSGSGRAISSTTLFKRCTSYHTGTSGAPPCPPGAARACPSSLRRCS